MTGFSNQGVIYIVGNTAEWLVILAADNICVISENNNIELNSIYS